MHGILFDRDTFMKYLFKATITGMSNRLLVHIAFIFLLRHVQGELNFAFNKTAHQSTTLTWTNFNWTADKAVDGNTNGSYPETSKTCSATNPSSISTNHTWEVDIGVQIIFKTIRVYGRTDVGWDQLNGFTVYLGNTSGLWTYNNVFQPISWYENPSRTYKLILQNVRARFISLMRFDTILTICEVTVEGECVTGEFGDNCSGKCGNCLLGDVSCSKSNGSCSGGCKAGWQDDDCKTECENGTYGFNCNETCGQCIKGNKTCTQMNGTCTGGCQAGWGGQTCKSACKNGNYGFNCNETCGHCINGNKTCSQLNGTCKGGCQAGWGGETCKSACKNGTYGFNCNETCGQCITGNNTCSQLNGTCKGGCQAGWDGETCTSACKNGTYGFNCNETCGQCINGNSTCSQLNGTCKGGCQAGWGGETCKSACNSGTYGFNCNETCGQCINGSKTCSQFNGTCTGGCQAGWEGETCKSGCEIGKFGYNCNETCGYCLHGNVNCFTSNGSCNNGCDAGWQDDNCKIGCDMGKFGYNCNQTCGNCLNGTISCSKLNGTCSSGCEYGWQGNDCKKNKLSQPESKTQFPGEAVGGAAAALVLIAVIVIVIIVFHRKRRRKSPPSDMPRANNGNIYENSLTMNFNYDQASVQNVEDSTNRKQMTALRDDEEIETQIQSENPETYYNVSRGLPKGTILLSNYWDYVQEKCLDDKHFPEEFDNLPSGPQLSTNVALRPENRVKNRYKDLYAYDINRVILEPMGNDGNDYINASFIHGYSSQCMYIASQGTTKQNLNDFWRMLWQYDVEKIVMLTGLFEGGKHKCELYWPEDEGRSCTFGIVSVTLIDTDLFADYTIRTLEMSVGNNSKRLTHFHYTAWPDKGVPRATSSLVLFWNRVNRVPTKKPIVVHCSAGIGRTGTYIALDILVSQGRAEGNVNVWACVSNLRRQRVNLVQTKEQYIFLHETLVEALMLSGTATTSDKFPSVYQELLEIDGESGKRKLQLEYERLQHEDVNHETVYACISTVNDGDQMDLKRDEFADAKKPENKSKNRYDNIMPADRHRVFLNYSVPGRNDYINAVTLPSHRRRHGFILTQMPLESTIIDFWRMIHDLEVKTIVMLNSESFKTHDIGIYWPKKDNARYGPFSVRLVNQTEERNYIQRLLSYSMNGVEHERVVTQCQVTNWPENVNAPKSTTAFLETLDIIETWQNDEKPIVVHCLNGAERSGLFCVISTVIERLKLEKDVAITQTIKRMRAFRHQIIPNYEQFRFCHECIIEFMKNFETYTNC